MQSYKHCIIAAFSSLPFRDDRQRLPLRKPVPGPLEKTVKTNRCAELEKLSRELTEAYDCLLTTQTEVDFVQSKITKHLTVFPVCIHPRRLTEELLIRERSSWPLTQSDHAKREA